MKLTSILTLGLLPIFIGCSSMDINDFEGTSPKFIPEQYFNGPMTAYGLVKDRNGKIIRSFKGKLVGSWDENGTGTLDERFVYSDGEKQTRIWKLKPTGKKTSNQKTFIGTAGDIVGEAQMIAKGNTVMIDYTMRVPYKDSTIDINVRDWLHLQEDGVIINHSKMKKFGFEVGELVITIIKD
ncbi:MAG: FIG086212: Putative lipoprotein [uncultured Sulfurovum sp.]|uniref:FIG086212: Putative lipoprotein n=1 Tax=uncultured Sulfurovum sp. TaxID=269237 RepID=A0A6S6SP78_9BACT|nr:MAG: FIG086212: Putative lipoprotein [uncultured Sulfurovum sp.]